MTERLSGCKIERLHNCIAAIGNVAQDVLRLWNMFSLTVAAMPGTNSSAMRQSRITHQMKFARGAILASLMVLSACQTVQQGISSLNLDRFRRKAPNTQSQVPTVAAQPKGEIIGSGRVRVALLLPKSAPGNGARIATEFSNAARLAMRDFGQTGIQLVIKDTAGQPAQAQLVASEAVNERSSVILGPIFAGNVSAASSVSQPARVPMIAFTSDTSLARRNVYLMSFAPESDVRRTLNFAISRGRNSIIALLPNNSYGNLVEKSMRSVVSRAGGQLRAVVKYDRSGTSIEAAARSVAVAATSANAIYIPDDGKAAAAVIDALGRAGVPLKQMKLLGSGQWESANFASGQFEGAWFAGRDKKSFGSFAARYKAAFKATPSPNAGLAYDAVSMAAGLIRRNARSPFAPRNIESQNGFSGVNGIFRLRSDGKSERGLVIYEVKSGSLNVVSPAPAAFGSGY